MTIDNDGGTIMCGVPKVHIMKGVGFHQNKSGNLYLWNSFLLYCYVISARNAFLLNWTFVYTNQQVKKNLLLRECWRYSNFRSRPRLTCSGQGRRCWSPGEPGQWSHQPIQESRMIKHFIYRYVGSHCVIELLKEDFNVICIDNFVNSHKGK